MKASRRGSWGRQGMAAVGVARSEQRGPLAARRARPRSLLRIRGVAAMDDGDRRAALDPDGLPPPQEAAAGLFRFAFPSFLYLSLSVYLSHFSLSFIPFSWTSTRLQVPRRRRGVRLRAKGPHHPDRQPWGPHHPDRQVRLNEGGGMWASRVMAAAASNRGC
jgi:hypothetical protein